MRSGRRSRGGIPEPASRRVQTHEHAVADGPGVARMTSATGPERMNELSDGVTRPFNATAADRRGPILEIPVNSSTSGRSENRTFRQQAPVLSTLRVHGDNAHERWVSTEPAGAGLTKERGGPVIHHERSACALSFRFLVVMTAVVAALLSAWKPAAAGDRGALTLLTTVPIPVTAANSTAGALYSFDASWVDRSVQAYFLADRSNRVVDVVDARTATFLGQVSANPPFRGFQPCGSGPGTPPAPGPKDCAGPNGVVAAFPGSS